jgi:opacity protein-like surface antigen
MKFRILAIAAIVMTTASMAAAETRETSRAMAWDLSIETRYTQSHDYSGDNNTSLSLDDDLGWGFGFSYNMNERFSLGMLFSWRSVNYNATYEDATDPAVVTGTYGGELDTGTFAAMGQWNILPKSFTPYVNGGIGWTLIDTNVVADYQTGCWYDPWWGYVCSGYTSTYGTDCASFAAGVGVRFEPNEKLFIQVGYEMDWLDIDNVDSFDMFRVDVGITNN